MTGFNKVPRASPTVASVAAQPLNMVLVFSRFANSLIEKKNIAVLTYLRILT